MANISCKSFTQFLVRQEPVYDSLILRDIRPEDGLIGVWNTGTFDSYSGVTHTIDRFNHVWPNTTKAWVPVSLGNCIGTPCDKVEHEIGWGSTRRTFGLEEISYKSPLLCFDQLMHVTHAKQQFSQIISDILKPATSAIMSAFLRKRAAQLADKKWIANKTMDDFTYNWVTVGDEEIYIDCSAIPTSKLTPQMLQRRVNPLMLKGYFGKQPFKDMPPLIELMVPDLESCWELDKLANVGAGAGANTPTVSGNWRFTQWDAANQYWRYGFSGQLGNYAIKVDPMGFRFNYVGVVAGKYRFQLVLPYKNVPSSGAGDAAGLKSVENPYFQTAQYCFSLINHRKGMTVLTADTSPVNPEMPFATRNFAGKYQFVMDNLGTGTDGCVIENKRRNKGQFINDFKLSVRPEYTELMELIFHKREPACVIEVPTCNADPGAYPQDYNSENTPC